VLSAIRKAAVLGKAAALDRKTAEKLLFNIGRIPLRQSHEGSFAGGKRQILPPGRKGGPRQRSVVYRMHIQDIEITRYFLDRRVARSLLI
jgi:hypothetical protein